MSELELSFKKCKEIYKKIGYYIHAVEDEHGQIYNVHTHGLLVSKGKIDYEIIITPSVNLKQAQNILTELAENMSYIEIKDGLEVPLYINDGYMNAIFKLTSDKLSHNLTYKIIFSDKDGNYPWDTNCDEEYILQWTERDEYFNKMFLLRGLEGF